MIERDVPVVLLVEQDREERERCGGWLEEAGYDVLSCPGPSAPDYTCVGGRGDRCPLAEAADLVILDMWLAGDDVVEGMTAADLLDYYRWLEIPVLALSRRYGGSSPDADPQVRAVAWPAERTEFLTAVRESLGSAVGR